MHFGLKAMANLQRFDDALPRFGSAFASCAAGELRLRAAWFRWRPESAPALDCADSLCGDSEPRTSSSTSCKGCPCFWANFWKNRSDVIKFFFDFQRPATYVGVFVTLVFSPCLHSGRIVTTDISSVATFRLRPHLRVSQNKMSQQFSRYEASWRERKFVCLTSPTATGLATPPSAKAEIIFPFTSEKLDFSLRKWNRI